MLGSLEGSAVTEERGGSSAVEVCAESRQLGLKAQARELLFQEAESPWE